MSDGEEAEQSGSHRRATALERPSATLTLDAKTLMMGVVLLVGGGGGTFAGHLVTGGASSELVRKVEEASKKVDDVDRKIDLLVASDTERKAQIATVNDAVAAHEGRIQKIERVLAAMGKLAP